MKLGLGTVQFGLAYGVSNSTGEISTDEASLILDTARSGGIRTIDTAAAYGSSEARLGALGLVGFEVVSKLSGVAPSELDKAVRSSLARLKVDSLDGLLMHRPGELNGPDGAETWSILEHLKSEGLIKKLGVSVYCPEDLSVIPPAVTLDLVQLPYNIVDRRMETSGWLDRLKDQGVEVHARSAFLQGLLLMEPAERPQNFSRWNDMWQIFENWLSNENLTRLDACLGFALANPLIDRIIVGTQSADQLQELMAVKPLDVAPPSSLSTKDDNLLNPGNWNVA